MSIKAITTRYAHALLEETERLNAEAAIEQDIATVLQYLDASNDLRITFRSPVIEPWRKKKIVKELFEDKVQKLTLTFLLLVIEKGRERMLRDIFVAFHEQLDVRRNIMRIGITSAVGLDAEMQDKLTAALSKKTGKTVVSTFSTSEALIGGVSVTIGDAVIDGSLRTRLAELKEQLANN